ncbi:MAG TPA: ATP-binding protein [Terracidiphilus sp.]|nr:ATP-binding protein [Terracidiphilus sp.]
MDKVEKRLLVESLPWLDVADALRPTRPFTDTPPEALDSIGPVDCIRLSNDQVLVEPGEPVESYWIVTQGSMRAEHPESDGSFTLFGVARAGDAFGEVPLLTGKSHIPFRISAAEDSVVIRLTSQQFWSLMACCPAARGIILADNAQRLRSYQVEALHREKLVSLGTLAAGLMHELHNPGAAAKHSASQLRENLLKLQQLSLRSSSKPKTAEQLECMKSMLEHILKGCRLAAMSSLDEADAEEAMGEWLAAAGVENAFTLAPALVSMGFDQKELTCAREFFDAPSFSDALNWLGALVSSVSLVCAIEESISRISDLVMAVKKFAYDERSPARDLDVHDSLQSTLTILGHKLRLKQIQVEKRFEASPAVIHTRGSALSQVWTNLIDNAADASPQGGQIEITTWTETDTTPGWLVVCIRDHGTGIPTDLLPRIFDAFFTTKPQGSGTGLGLEIVHRIITQKFGGTIQVESQPGNTRFLVRLPLADASAKASAS